MGAVDLFPRMVRPVPDVAWEDGVTAARAAGCFNRFENQLSALEPRSNFIYVDKTFPMITPPLFL